MHLQVKKLNLHIFTNGLESELPPGSIIISSPTPDRWKLLIPHQTEFFLRICFPSVERGQGETMIYFIKIQSENMTMTWNISLFIFSVICNFFRYDDFLIIKHSQHCMVLILLFSTLEPNVTLKLHKKTATLMIKMVFYWQINYSPINSPHWEIQVRKNLEVCNVWFLICFFRLSFTTLTQVKTAKKNFVLLF